MSSKNAVQTLSQDLSLELQTLIDKAKVEEKQAELEKPNPVGEGLKKAGLGAEILARINTTAKAALSWFTQSSEGVRLQQAGVNLAEVQAGFEFVSLGFALIGFLQIPLYFLVCRIAGEKPEIKLNTLGNWAYSGAILGLALAAFFLPSVVAIGLGAAAFVFTVNVGRLAFFTYEYVRDRDAYVQVTEALESDRKNLVEATSKLEECLQELETLEGIADETILAEKRRAIYDDLTQILAKDGSGVKPIPGSFAEEDFVNAVKAEFKRLDEVVNETRAIVEEKEKEKADLEAALKTKDPLAAFDKVFGSGLATVALSAAIIFLFFPPVAAAMGMGVAAVGLSYLLIRGGMALYGMFTKPQVSAPVATSTLVSSPSPVVSPNVTPTPVSTPSPAVVESVVAASSPVPSPVADPTLDAASVLGPTSVQTSNSAPGIVPAQFLNLKSKPFQASNHDASLDGANFLQHQSTFRDALEEIKKRGADELKTFSPKEVNEEEEEGENEGESPHL